MTYKHIVGNSNLMRSKVVIIDIQGSLDNIKSFIHQGFPHIFVWGHLCFVTSSSGQSPEYFIIVRILALKPKLRNDPMLFQVALQISQFLFMAIYLEKTHINLYLYIIQFISDGAVASLIYEIKLLNMGLHLMPGI